MMADLPVGVAVKIIREHFKLTQAQVADRMGCPRTYISKVENGHAVPQIDQLMRLAHSMQIEGWRLLRYIEKLKKQMEAA